MKKLKSLTCLLILFLVSACNGQSSTKAASRSRSSSSDSSSSQDENNNNLYDGYYASLTSWENGEDLKNQLHTIIRNGYQPLSYTKSGSQQNYTSNIDADHSKYDFEYLDVVYSADNVFKTETNTGWQREHAWCASLMCGSGTTDAIKYLGRATDFHNLFAASTNGNTARGNKNYGTADSSNSKYTDRTVRYGDDGYSYDSVVFEPADFDKGRLSRAIFYMATMYKDDEQDTVNNILMKGLRIVEDDVGYDKGSFTGEEFAIGHLSDLLLWNSAFEVDYLEMQHNLSVYKNTNNPDGIAQGNRNPYVDFPNLADYVYGRKKNLPGTIKDLVPSISYLHCDEDTVSHYAIKEAKREYGYGDQISANDYEIVEVKKNYTYAKATTGITNSQANYTFVESDGDNKTIEIETPINNISYQVSLNPLSGCSSGVIALSADGVNKYTPDVDQEVTYGEKDFIINYSTSYSSYAENGLTITNISGGGVTYGSGTKPITALTIKTKESYTINAAYIKAFAGNKSSSYTLTIKVGDEVLLPATTVNNYDALLFGQKINEPLTGQLSYIFVGMNSLKINSIAFNAIIA